MRLAIIADTHLPRGNRAIPDECLERCSTADAILHAGDLVSIGVLDLLQELGPPVHAIHGNVDHPEVRMRLPHVRQDVFAGVHVAMVHDAGSRQGRLDRLRRRFPEADAVVFGHSHIPEHAELGGFHIFNPGSPTERRRAPAHTMGEAEIESRRIRFSLIALD
jgi:uncharacterized protein